MNSLVSFLNLYISDFVEFYKDTLNNHSKIINNGRHIKNIFIEYRKNLHNIDCLKNISNKKIQNIINDCEGNQINYMHVYLQHTYAWAGTLIPSSSRAPS